MPIFKILTISILTFIPFLGISQGLPGGGVGGKSDRIDGKFKFIPLPYVDYDCAAGFTIGAIPMGMFNLSEKDTVSPSSVAGLLGMYSENKTWF